MKFLLRTPNTRPGYMRHYTRFWCLSHWGTAKAKISLPKLPQSFSFSHIKSIEVESSPKLEPLASLGPDKRTFLSIKL